MRSALGSSGFSFPAGGLVVNLAPAKERKEGSGFDLAIALAVLTTAGHLRPPDRLRRVGAAAELGLDGRLRPVHGVLAMMEAAGRLGLDGMLVAPENAAEAALAGTVAGAGADPSERGGRGAGRDGAAARAARAGAGGGGAEPPRPGRRARPAAGPAGGRDRGGGRPQPADDRAARQRQDDARPPPAGATARAHAGRGAGDHADSSAAGELAADAGLLDRPFRAPHHSASVAALVGNARLRPGEVTMAHRGVLFLDELPEFNRQALEALRMPLEDGEVRVSRAAGLGAAPGAVPADRRHEPLSLRPVRRSRPRVRLRAAAAGRLPGADQRTAARPLRPAGRRAAGRGARRGRGTDGRRSRCASGWPGSCWPSGGRRWAARRRRCSRQAADRRFLSGRGVDRAQRVAQTIAALSGEAEVAADHLAEALSYRTGSLGG